MSENDAIDLQFLPTAVRESAEAAAKELIKVLRPGQSATASRLAGGVYVVVSGPDEARAYETHDAPKLVRGERPEPVTKLGVAVHYFMRTGRTLVDGAGKHVLDAKQVAALEFARLYPQ
jgi:hypothetical protein